VGAAVFIVDSGVSDRPENESAQREHHQSSHALQSPVEATTGEFLEIHRGWR
jgi:hypothetical protein